MRAMTPRRLPLGVQSSRSSRPTGSICSPPEPGTAWPARNASTAGADLDGANSQLDRLTESTRARSVGRGAIAHGIRAARAPRAETTTTPLAPSSSSAIAETLSCTLEDAPGPRLRWAGCAVNETFTGPGWSGTSPNPTSSGLLDRFLTVSVWEEDQPARPARPKATVAGSTESSAVDAAAGSMPPAPSRVTGWRPPRGSALPTSTARSSDEVSPVRAWETSAAAPAATAAAALEPLTVEYRGEPSADGSNVASPTPGATTSGFTRPSNESPPDENPATASSPGLSTVPAGARTAVTGRPSRSASIASTPVFPGRARTGSAVVDRK